MDEQNEITVRRKRFEAATGLRALRVWRDYRIIDTVGAGLQNVGWWWTPKGLRVLTSEPYHDGSATQSWAEANGWGFALLPEFAIRLPPITTLCLLAPPYGGADVVALADHARKWAATQTECSTAVRSGHT